MPNRLVTASGSAKIAIGVSLLALGALTSMLSNADNAFLGGYRTALAGIESERAGETAQWRDAGFSRISQTQSAASEDYWLGHAGRTNTVPVAWTRSLGVGDTVTVSTKQGERKLRVESIAEMPTTAQDGDRSHKKPLMFVVTARETGRPDGFVVRMVVEDSKGAMLHHGKTVSDRNL